MRAAGDDEQTLPTDSQGSLLHEPLDPGAHLLALGVEVPTAAAPTGRDVGV